MDPASVLDAARNWTPSERLELALRLWDDLVGDGWQPAPDEELAAEIDRRLDAHEANPADVRTSEQVWERVRRRP